MLRPGGIAELTKELADRDGCTKHGEAEGTTAADVLGGLAAPPKN